MLSFNNWITYDPAGSAEEEENEVNNKEGSNKKSNIAKIDDDNHKNPIKLLPIVGKDFSSLSNMLSASISIRLSKLTYIKI